MRPTTDDRPGDITILAEICWTCVPDSRKSVWVQALTLDIRACHRATFYRVATGIVAYCPGRSCSTVTATFPSAVTSRTP
jgi:hypothetical protein